MFMRMFVILFSTAFACIIVAMALEGGHNPLSVFGFAHVVVLFGMLLSFPAMIYGYLKGTMLWEDGVREIKPYLKAAVFAALINAGALGFVLAVPFMEGGLLVFIMLLGAFALGGLITAAVSFTLMQTIEKNSTPKK